MVDTRNKRASVLGLGLAFLVVLPTPDVDTEDIFDRQHVAFCYRGIESVTHDVIIAGYVVGAVALRAIGGFAQPLIIPGGTAEEIES